MTNNKDELSVDAVDILNKRIKELEAKNKKLLEMAKLLGAESQGWKISEGQCSDLYSELAEENRAQSALIDEVKKNLENDCLNFTYVLQAICEGEFKFEIDDKLIEVLERVDERMNKSLSAIKKFKEGGE